MKSISGQIHDYIRHKQQPMQHQHHESTTNGMARSMAEKLGIGSEPRELKLGTTFTGNKCSSFHTLKYDFKPASVDITKVALLDVGQNNNMTVTVPHLDGSGTTHTIFQGSQRPYSKECVLIFDKRTGEFTLERLSANIQVKRTRSQTKPTPLLAVPSSLRPITPIEQGKSPTDGRTTSRTKVISGKKREPSHQLPAKANPKRFAFSSKSPTVGCSSAVTPAGHPSFGSLPMITEQDDYSLPILGNSTVSKTSQSTTSTKSSSSALPATVSPANSKRVSPTYAKGVSPAVRDKATAKVPMFNNDVGTLSDSSSSSSSDSSDSDSEPETKNPPTKINGCAANGINTSSPLSMPDNLLSEDLQLSESESDSD